MSLWQNVIPDGLVVELHVNVFVISNEFNPG